MHSSRLAAWGLLAALGPALASHALGGSAAASPQPPFEIHGTVHDLTGAPVTGARVRASGGGRVVAEQRTDANGRFSLALPAGVFDLTATAADMAPASAHVVVPGPGAAPEPVRLVLGAALFSASVTVAAPPAEPDGIEGSVSVVPARDVGLVPARALDEVLAATPGFSLFRRSSSRTANPTAQGVSLRGLGASGASRALVLADGFPINDPFGGWISWRRLPAAAIERVEVARGGRSDRHGASAMGGVVDIVTASASAPLEAQGVAGGGSRGTFELSGWAGVQRGAWNAVASLDGGRSGRAPVVAPGSRGPIDTPAGVDHAAGLAAVSWAPGAFHAAVRFNPFWEDRANGTPFQRNDTRAGQVSAVAGGGLGGGQWEARAWGQWTRYRQTFSAIADDRASETPVRRQRVESSAAGARVRWDQSLGPALFGGGIEVRRVEADNHERALAVPSAAEQAAGGRQRGPALFGRVSVALGGRVRVDAGGRWERWRNTPSGQPAGARQEQAFSPRATISWAPIPGVIAHGSAYGAFRPPTLNELYRGFRVGAITTRPNELLGPERLKGVEAGLGLTRHRLALRATVWRSRLDHSIANVTTGLFERQRQNVGSVAGRGLEAEVVVRPARGVEWSSAVALTRSVFDDPARPAIDGRRVPQVPGTQWSSRLHYDSSRAWGAIELRRWGAQFEDDLNDLELRPGLTLDLAAGYRLRRGLEVLASVENLADAEIEVGRTPVPTIGLPRSFQLTVRVGWPRPR